MLDADPQGLEDRQPCNRRKKRNGKFATCGVTWMMCLVYKLRMQQENTEN